MRTLTLDFVDILSLDEIDGDLCPGLKGSRARDPF
jgi:hypothetical protein